MAVSMTEVTGPVIGGFDNLGRWRSPHLCELILSCRGFLMSDHTTLTLTEFTSPIDDILNSNPYARKCETLTDEDWTIMNIKRVLSECSSGRNFLQTQAINGEKPIWTSHYFEALKSSAP